jgi:hypothetical protein
MTTTVSTRGQTVIPAEIRRKYGSARKSGRSASPTSPAAADFKTRGASPLLLGKDGVNSR